jgi:phage portal protein BeeE
MLHRLKRLLGPAEQKASRTARLIQLESPGRARWTPRDYAALAREGFAANAIVHRAIKLVAENVGALTFLVYEGAKALDKHPLADLLARPNPRQDGPSFLEAVTAYLLISGNSYIEAVNLDGAVRAHDAQRPDRRGVVPGPDGWAQAYEYTVASRAARSSMPGRTARCSPTANTSGSSANSKAPIRARPMPAARCCSKAGSTGRRCR